MDWGSYIISIARTTYKKIQTLIRSVTIWSYIVCCCHIWAGAPSCYLKFLDKLQKRISWPVGTSLTASLTLLAHCQNLASQVFSIGITLVDNYLNLMNWFRFLILVGGPPVVLIDYMIFLPPFLDVAKMSKSAVSFLAQLNSGILCNSRSNRHLLIVVFF